MTVARQTQGFTASARGFEYIRSVQSLFSTGVRLPASAYPEPADAYVCDDCGREITKHLRPGTAHCWQAMGPRWYVCDCGRKWLSGAVEWDHLGYWERKRRIRDTLHLSALFSIVSLLIVLLVYLALQVTGISGGAGLSQYRLRSFQLFSSLRRSCSKS